MRIDSFRQPSRAHAEVRLPTPKFPFLVTLA
ncbi:protein of unknown function [Methylorubrum extorquens]|uniref:Uncharacterized protein n=1 Tax=Methylorubrum extorquens TaxID=408 RepID=A0A2N9AUA2_METEX|nr:protein of unknown function [Methylorubrum extorquens]